MQYVRSMNTSAREKDKAGAVIEALVVKNCCDVDRCNLMKQLLETAHTSKPGNGKLILEYFHNIKEVLTIKLLFVSFFLQF